MDVNRAYFATRPIISQFALISESGADISLFLPSQKELGADATVVDLFCFEVSCETISLLPFVIRLDKHAMYICQIVVTPYSYAVYMINLYFSMQNSFIGQRYRIISNMIREHRCYKAKHMHIHV